MNSTTVLHTLECLSKEQNGKREIDISDLAVMLNVTTTVLVAVLTELEHRDEIIINITTGNNLGGSSVYTGTIKLMGSPPDELRNTEENNDDNFEPSEL